MILRPRTLNIVLLALLLIPLWGAGLWDILRFGELLAGFGLIGLAVLIWVPGIAGVRVVAGNDHVEMYRLFWRVWKVGISHLVIREGLGGDLPILPAFILQQEGKRDSKGYLVKSLFAPDRLEEFLAFLTKKGAVRG
jgi:hypothetical protein